MPRRRNSKNNPRRKTQKNGKLSSATAARKSTNHGRASRFIYVTLDPPRERADFVDLEAPSTSYGPRRGRIARSGEGSLTSSGSSKNLTRYTPSPVVLALVFPRHHNPSSPLHQK